MNRIVITTLFVCSLAATAQTVVPYDPGGVSGLVSTGKYTVSVNGTTVPVMTYGYPFQGTSQRKHWAWFAFGGGPVTVDVTYKPGTVSSYTVSPKRNPVAVTQPASNVLRFTLSSPRPVVIRDINGDSEAIVLLADPLESGAPAVGSGVRFNGNTYCSDTTGSADSTSCLQSAINAASSAGGGTVTVGAGKFRITSRLDVKAKVELYTAPGSMIFFPKGLGSMPREGVIVYDGASVTGRGVFYGNGADNTYQNLMYTRGSNITLRGFMILDSQTTGLRLWGVSQTLDRLKILSAQGGLADGIDFTGANTVTIQDSFIISTDDNISFGFGDNAFGNDTSVMTRDINVTRNLFWHLRTGADFKIIPCVSTEVSNIVLDDNDVIEGETLLALYGSGTNNIHDITIRNTRVEGTRNKPIEFVTPGSGFYSWSLGNCDMAGNGTIHHIKLDGVTIDQYGSQQSALYGNPGHTVHDVNFNSVSIGGKAATDTATANMYVDSATTSNITFTSAPVASTPTSPTAPQAVTILALSPSSYTQAPGSNLQFTTHWAGGPTGSTAYTIFTHIVDASGNIVAAENHNPAKATTSWSGTYDDVGPSILIPANLATGTYRILAGLYNAGGDNSRYALATGPGVVSNGDGRYQIGTLNVALSQQPITVNTLSPSTYSQVVGTTLKLTTRWSGGPTGSTAYTIFTHVIDANGNIVMYENHAPATSTTTWSSTYSDSGTSMVIPKTLAAGTYRILVGLYNAGGDGSRLPLVAGSGVTAIGDSRYQVGTLTVRLR